MSAGLTTASSPRTMRPQSQRSSARSPRAGHSGLGGHIELRCDSEIDSIRAAGALVASALEAAKKACVIGATTADIDRAAHTAITLAGGEPIFIGYRGVKSNHPAFPAATCISVNDELVHGVPSGRVICNGDLVSIDVGARLNGWCADSATTICVGDVSHD